MNKGFRWNVENGGKLTKWTGLPCKTPSLLINNQMAICALKCGCVRGLDYMEKKCFQ